MNRALGAVAAVRVPAGATRSVVPAGERGAGAWPRATLAAVAALALVAGTALWPAPGGSRPDAWLRVAALAHGLAWCAAAHAARRAAAATPPRAGAWTARALLGTGLCLLAAGASLALWPAGAPFDDLAWLALAVLLPVALVPFPQGRPATRKAVVATGVLVVLGLAGLALPALVEVVAWAWSGSPALGVGEIRASVALVEGVLLASWLWWRGEHADGPTQVALLWVALGAASSGLLVGHLLFVVETAALPGPVLAVLGIGLSLLFPAAVAVATAAPRRYDVRRSSSLFAVSVIMVDLTIAMVSGTLGLLAWMTGAPATKGTIAVVACCFAVAFGPVLVRVRRITDEVLFGGYTDPLSAMSRLGAELGAGSSPDAWAEALRSALVVPRVLLRRGGAVVGDARDGQGLDGGVTERTPLHAGTEEVGDLVVTLPPETTRLPRASRAVLDLVAAPLARALQAVALAEELHASRERVVQAREEERRRLRRDLHDGLGPVLTGVAYTADAAGNLLRTDVDRAEALLGQLREDTADAISEIRRIVQGLRPPALDEVGLAGALTQHAVRYGGAARVSVRCTVAEASSPGRLPASVEVVAYRVAVEAVTNALRHARPRTAEPLRVEVAIEPGQSTPALDLATPAALVVTVTDDGLPSGTWATGTGLASMAARCDVVGGTLVAAPTPAGGRVEVRLPLRRVPPGQPADVADGATSPD